MSTPGVVNGTLIKLKLDGTAVAYATSSELSFKNDLRETTNKDTSGKATYLGGKFSGSISIEGKHVEGGAKGFSVLFAAVKAGSVLAFEVSSDVSGDKNYTGNCLLSDLKRTHPDNADVTFSATMTITGDVSEGTE